MTNKTYTNRKTDENQSKKQKILAMEKKVVTSGILYVRLVVLLYRIVKLRFKLFLSLCFLLIFKLYKSDIGCSNANRTKSKNPNSHQKYAFHNVINKTKHDH